MKRILLFFIQSIIYGILCFSCKPLTFGDLNSICIYAPDNSVDVYSITQDFQTGRTSTYYEKIDDNRIHCITTHVVSTKAGPTNPEEDYLFKTVASNLNEYYVFSYSVLKINKQRDDLVAHCAKYGTDRVINAIKEQAPDYIMCISSINEQKNHGSYFRSIYMLDHFPNIIIEQ